MDWRLVGCGCLLGVSAVAVANVAHQSTSVVTIDAQHTQEEWHQNFPEWGKAVSGVMAIGAGATIWLGCKTDSKKTTRSSETAVASQQLQRLQQIAPGTTYRAGYTMPPREATAEADVEDSDIDIEAYQESLLGKPAPLTIPSTQNAPPPAMGDYPEVRSLPDEGSVYIFGPKGSGKTQKLAWIVGEHVRAGHLVWFVNPFAPARQFKGLKVWGRGLDYAEAAEGIRAFTKEAKDRIRRRGKEEDFDPFKLPHMHLALDEVSNYGKTIDEIDDTVMPGFWEINTQFLRQANMSCSLVSHGDTQALMGGEKALKGKSKAMKADGIRLYCQAVTDISVNGKKRCAGWAEMHSAEGIQRIKIPAWMQGPNPDCDYRELLPSKKVVAFERKISSQVASTDSLELEDVWAND